MPTLDGKVAIVTGATVVEPGGLNIGGAIATELVRGGARVVLADVNSDGAQALAGQLNADGDRVALAVPTDIRREDDIARLVAETVAAFGRIDIVANNAGIFPGGDGKVADLAIDVWDDVIAVNVRGAMLLTKHAIPHLLAAGGGAIVNTSSTHSFAGDLQLTAYGASKSAVNALTVYTATQYARQGIRCNAVCPGTTLSPPVQQAPEQFRGTYERHTLNPRLNAPEDLAKVVAFLASDDSRGINGMIVRADGGLLAHQPFTADFADNGAPR
ncbi:SDR family NAD(P)-dependent oxidoreductase [Streptomyces sp. NPDC058001]|uniref:SDR family NAD(P)-dependent oxidoreductase n=1 Tax=Streptomyces sp. NPDC058001 TaxID=3346300 RepID=UPI0036EDA1BC